MEKQFQNGVFTVPIHLGTTHSEIYKYKSIGVQRARKMIDEGDHHDKIFSFEVKKSQKNNDRDRYFKDQCGRRLKKIELQLPNIDSPISVDIRDVPEYSMYIFWKTSPESSHSGSDHPGCSELSHPEISKWIVAWISQKECLWPCEQEKGNRPKFNIKRMSWNKFKLISNEEWKSQSSQKIIPAEKFFPDE